MRLLHVLPSIASESGGPARSTLANCRALHAVDANVHLTLATTSQGLDQAWKKVFVARMPEGMELKVFAAIGQGAFTWSPSLASWLWKHSSEFDGIVIRALLHPVSSSAAWIARRAGTPYFLVPHGTLSRYTFEHRRTFLKRLYLYLVERHTLQGATGIRFTSEVERSEAPGSGLQTRTWVIPHPFEPCYSIGAPRHEVGEQVLFLSRLHPMKGLDILLEALPSVRDVIPNVRLVIAGSGTASFERDLKKRTETLGLRSLVQFAGFVEGEAKSRLLRESSVFVLPSRRENFGIAVVEAMDAGLPVIVSDDVAIADRIHQAEAGIVLPELRSDRLANAIVRLLACKTLRKVMGDRGQRLVRSEFEPRAVGCALRRVYGCVAEPSEGEAFSN